MHAVLRYEMPGCAFCQLLCLCKAEVALPLLAMSCQPGCRCPALAPSAPLQARRLIRPLRLSPSPPLRRRDPVDLVCLSKSLRILHRTSNVTNGVMSVSIHKAEVPRFRWGGAGWAGPAGDP